MSTPSTPSGTHRPHDRKAADKEKHDLQELNKRFEFYILQQREKDAATIDLGAEIKECKQQQVEELRNLRYRHNEQLSLLQKQRNEAEARQLTVKDELQRTQSTIAYLESKMEAQKQKDDDYQAQLMHLVVTNKKLKEDLFRQQDTNRELDRKAAAFNKHCSDLSKSLPVVQMELEDVAKETQTQRANAVSLRDELNQCILEAERVHLNMQRQEPEVYERHEATAKEKDDRRRQAMIADLEVQNENRTNANVATLTHMYEAKCAGYRSQIENLENERDTLENEKKNTDALQERILLLQAEVAGKKDDMANSRANMENALADKNMQIANVKAGIKRKMRQMDELLEQKLPFDVELYQLEQALTDEERRLNIGQNAGPVLKKHKSKGKAAPVQRRTSSRLSKASANE